jgi:hypothetical protein
MVTADTGSPARDNQGQQIAPGETGLEEAAGRNLASGRLVKGPTGSSGDRRRRIREEGLEGIGVRYRVDEGLGDRLVAPVPGSKALDFEDNTRGSGSEGRRDLDRVEQEEEGRNPAVASQPSSRGQRMQQAGQYSGDSMRVDRQEAHMAEEGRAQGGEASAKAKDAWESES